jgi:hypothetical protein
MPPYRGVISTMFGMTWARAFIFYGSDRVKAEMKTHKFPVAVQNIVPTMTIATFVQIVNQPLIRCTITVQDPTTQYKSVYSAMRYRYSLALSFKTLPVRISV